jgi:hypothetical protein
MPGICIQTSHVDKPSITSAIIKTASLAAYAFYNPEAARRYTKERL